MWAGVLPVLSSMLGTSRPWCEISLSLSSSDDAASSESAASAASVFSSSELSAGAVYAISPEMSPSLRISARTPQTTLVLPSRTTALPLQWVKLPVLSPGVRNSCVVRPLARRLFLPDGEAVERCACRNGCGEIAAKMGRGKVRAGDAFWEEAVVAMIALSKESFAGRE